MMMKRNWTLSILVPAVIPAMIAVSACGDDGGDGNTGTPDAAPAITCLDESAIFRDSARENNFDSDPQLGDALSATAPSFLPMAGSPVLSGGATPPGGLDRSATFIGAIGTDDWTAGWTAYPDGTTVPDQGTVTMIPAGEFITNQTWTTGDTYVLEGPVFFTGGAILTIQPGVVVRGMSGSALVITNQGRINAAGTLAQPIIFTSASATAAMPGDWGGVVLLGDARINATGGKASIEGFTGADPENIVFGDNDNDHNCGLMNYVRIEYAGFKLGDNNKLGGLTVAGCGNNTELDFIQVHRGDNDGVEFLGGKADLRHAVITLAEDDGIDWSLGWTGDAQFVIVQQSPTAGENGLEADNNEQDNDASPRSAPEIWNATLIGSNDAAAGQSGATLRRGTAGVIGNAIIAHFGRFAVDVSGESSVQQLVDENLTIRSSYFFQNAAGMHWPENFDGRGTDQNDCTMAAE